MCLCSIIHNSDSKGSTEIMRMWCVLGEMGKVKLHFQYNVPDMKYASIYA